MNFDPCFETIVNYDAGMPGISLDVELRLGTASTKVQAKIDTGSTHCIFARNLAHALDIEVESGDPLRMSTVQNSFLVYGHRITLIAAGCEFDTAVFFAVDENISRNVLGRRGWLDRVILGINDYDGKLYLSPYSK